MVPSGWKSKEIGDISLNITSGSRDWAQYYSENGSKFIRMTNLNRDGINLLLDDLKYVKVSNDSADGKRTSLESGDILISITAELGKIGLVPENFGEAFINQHTALIRIDKNLADSKFIAYQLSSSKLNKIINSYNDAGAKAGLNLPTIKSIPILYPPIFEQKKIAQILSTWDEAIATTEKLLENSQKQKQALMQKLLTGKKRFSGFSGNWSRVKMSEIANIEKGKAISSEGIFVGKYPVIAGGKSSPYKHNSFTHENVITVSASGAYAGYVAYHPYKIWASDCSVISSKPNTSIKYIFFYLEYKQKQIYSLQSGGAQPHIYPKDLGALKLELPSVAEQEKIASVLNEADKGIQTIQTKLDLLKEEKMALMQQLLTGKKRVKLEG